MSEIGLEKCPTKGLHRADQAGSKSDVKVLLKEVLAEQARRGATPKALPLTDALCDHQPKLEPGMLS